MATPEGAIIMFMTLESLGCSWFGKPTEDQLEAKAYAYSAAFLALPDDELLDLAVEYSDRGGRGIPSVGELKALLPPSRLPATWEAGWDLMTRKLSRYDKTPLAEMTWGGDDEAIRAGIQAVGGKKAICDSKAGCPFVRRDFRAAYEAVQAKRKSDDQRRVARLTRKVLTRQMTHEEAVAQLERRPALQLIEGGRP